MPETIALEIEVDDKGTPKVRAFAKSLDGLSDSGRKGGAAAEGATSRFGRLANMAGGAASKVGGLVKHLAGLAIGGVAAGVAGVTAALFGLSKAVGVASDLEEVTSKFQVVFDGMQDKAEGWAQELVKSYAMSTREARQYLAAMQDLLVPMGMVPGEAAEMSNAVVKLAADLGSFNNLPTGQVMGDIQSALVGNYETMKKYGVVLSATTVQEKALAMGLAATKDELTAAHRAQAAYQLIVAGSQAAIGDMARTSDGYANQVKKLKSNWEELTGLIGTAFLPYAKEVVSAINTWFAANKELIAQKAEVWAQRLGEYFHRAWEAASGIVTAVSAWYAANENLVDESLIIFLKGLWEIAKGVAAAFEAVGRAIGWAAAKIVELVEKAQRLKAVQWVTGLFAGSGEASATDAAAPTASGLPSSVPSFQTGTGPRGLPHTGLFFGHKGEIVKNPAESEAERQGVGGNTYHIHMSSVFGDEGSMRRAASAMKAELQLLDHRWGTS